MNPVPTSQPRRALAGVTITYPTDKDSPVLSPVGFLTVQASLANHSDTPEEDHIYAKVFKKDEEVGDDPDINDPRIVKLEPVTPGSLDYISTTVPVPEASLLGTEVQVAAWARLAGVWQGKNVTQTKIKARNQVADISVSARACLWLAYAPDNYGPLRYQESGPAYKPVKVLVPTDAQYVSITATGNGWSHHPGVTSGPDGIDAMLDLECPDDYKTSALNSLYIKGIKTNLNKLVGMVGVGPAEGDSTGGLNEEFEIGSQLDGHPLPSSTKQRFLYLAFHDGREWSNNDNAVTVSITFAASRLT